MQKIIAYHNNILKKHKHSLLFGIFKIYSYFYAKIMKPDLIL